MSYKAASPHEEILDLLALKVTDGIDEDEQRHIDAWLQEHPEIAADYYETSAAIAHLAVGTFDAAAAHAEVPDTLSQSLLALAAKHEARSSVATITPAVSPVARGEGAAPEDTTSTGVGSSVVSLDQHRPRARWLTQAGWWAAAACLALAVAGWWQTPVTPPPVDGTTVVTVVDNQPLTIDSVLQAPGTVIIPWSATEDPTAVAASGDVVWNNDLQKGFMRFRGLSKNLQKDFQYQLWIFDGTRDERFPVDGGVFDIFSDDLAVVPIEAKLPVEVPSLFAVTVEEPGGVVVSSRERITLVASV